MERLTKKFTDGGAYCEDIEDVGIQGINAPTFIGKSINKLAEYEDAEEEGFLFRFPCRIGDAVFFHWYCSDGTILVFPAEVKQINIGTFMLRKGIQYKIEPKGSPGMLKIFYHSDFGYSIFTTKEEAEAALQKKQEGKQ